MKKQSVYTHGYKRYIAKLLVGGMEIKEVAFKEDLPYNTVGDIKRTYTITKLIERYPDTEDGQLNLFEDTRFTRPKDK